MKSASARCMPLETYLEEKEEDSKKSRACGLVSDKKKTTFVNKKIACTANSVLYKLQTSLSLAEVELSPKKSDELFNQNQLDADLKNNIEINQMIQTLFKGSFKLKLMRNDNQLCYELRRCQFWFNGVRTGQNSLIESGAFYVPPSLTYHISPPRTGTGIRSLALMFDDLSRQKKYENNLNRNIAFWLAGEKCLLSILEATWWKDLSGPQYHLQYSLDNKVGPAEYLCNTVFGVLIATKNEINTICASYNMKYADVVRKVTDRSTKLMAVNLSVLGSSETVIKTYLSELLSAEWNGKTFRKNSGIRKIYKRSEIKGVATLESGELSIEVDYAKSGLLWTAMLFQNELPEAFRFPTLTQIYNNKEIPFPHWLQHKEEYYALVTVVEYMDKIVVSFPGGKRQLGETETNAVKREIFEETGLAVDKCFNLEVNVVNNNAPNANLAASLAGTFIFTSKDLYPHR
jgi:hypothetical protein